MYLTFYFKRSLELLSVALINITQISQCSKAIPMTEGQKKSVIVPWWCRHYNFWQSYQQKGFLPSSTRFFYSMLPWTSSFANLGRLQDLSIWHFTHEVLLSPAMQTPSFFRDLRTSFGTTVRTLFLFSSINIPTFFCLFQPNCKSHDDSIQLAFSLFIKVHSKL